MQMGAVWQFLTSQNFKDSDVPKVRKGPDGDYITVPMLLYNAMPVDSHNCIEMLGGRHIRAASARRQKLVTCIRNDFFPEVVRNNHIYYLPDRRSEKVSQHTRTCRKVRKLT